MEGGKEGDYIPIATLSPLTRTTSALRWAAMRATLMFHKLRGTKSKDSVHSLQLLKRKESRSGFEPRPLPYQANALPLGQTGSRNLRINAALLKRRDITFKAFVRLILSMPAQHATLTPDRTLTG